MADPFSLEGRLAVVTGARRGIGLAIAEALAMAGADVVGVSSAMEGQGGEARARVQAHGRRFWPIAADLADREAAAGLLGRLRDIGRPVDILVNDAGTIHRAPVVEHADGEWERVLEVNLNAPFRLARAIGSEMVGRGRGKIVFVASLLSFQGGVFVPGYTASKHAIAGVTKALANEWAPHASTSTRSRRATSTRTTRARCRTIPCAAARFWSASPRGAGAVPRTLAGRRCS
jgi:2-dehydro-3-deoxy-D-gluconate 5-dehydrogenase